MSTKIHAAKSPGVSGPHPGVEEWIAYHGRTLATGEEERLRSHLVTCPECVTLLLDVEAFERPHGEDPDQVSELERVAAWRSFQGALRRQEIREESSAGKPPATPWSQRMAIAASLLVAILGLSAWMAGQRANSGLRARLDALSAPQANAVIVDLYQEPTRRSGGETATEVPLGSPATLVLYLSEPQEYADYEVDILDEREETVWSSRGLELDPDFLTVTLALPGGSLPGGEYRIRLYGVGAGEKVLLGDYPPILLQPA